MTKVSRITVLCGWLALHALIAGVVAATRGTAELQPQLNTTDVVCTQRRCLFGALLDNDSYAAYLGVPYAEPPLHSRRFEPPAPLQGLAAELTVLNATAKAPPCLQWHDQALGSEDCLYLNVYVPHGGRRVEGNASLPVLFFVHGGGFMWGTPDAYGEQRIMQHGQFILVTFSYRLGPLGFLSTEDAHIAGNMGLKDQRLALQWVHENVAHFGGDASRVLLVGWSAGGASVHYHLVAAATPAAWFRAAVSLSGTALCPCHHIQPGEAQRKARQVAAQLNCTAAAQASNAELKRCLQAQPAEALARQSERFYKYGMQPFAVFGPVLEASTQPGSFLTDHVANLMRAGATKPKPWLVTRTAQDGGFGTAIFLSRDARGKPLIDELDRRWPELAPMLLYFDGLPVVTRGALAAQLRRDYFGDAAIGVASYGQLERLFNAELAVKHTQQSVELYARHTLGPQAAVYGYVYDNPAPYGYGQAAAQREDYDFGTMHGDDVFSLFRNDDWRGGHGLRPDESHFADALHAMLLQLAHGATPSYDGAPLGQLQSTSNYTLSRITSDGLDATATAFVSTSGTCVNI